MRNLFKVLAPSSASLLAFHATFALGTGLVCKDGQAFVSTTTYDTGCVIPPEPYYETMILHAYNPQGGNIDFRIGYTFRERNPRCDNPRGRPHFHYLPLPINQGNWKVFAEGELLGEVSFTTILPCKIKSNPIGP